MHFDDLKTEYRELYAAASILPDKASEVSAYARRISAARPLYNHVSALTGIPWFVVGILHAMFAECDRSRTALGRSVKAADWDHESFVDLHLMAGPWGTVEEIAFAFEQWSGWGYRERGLRSPFLWGLTNVQGHGLFVTDEVFVETALPNRPGAMALLRVLIEIDKGVDLTVEPVTKPAWSKAPQRPAPRKSGFTLAVAASTVVALLVGGAVAAHRVALDRVRVASQAELAQLQSAVADLERIRVEAIPETKEPPKPVAPVRAVRKVKAEPKPAPSWIFSN